MFVVDVWTLARAVGLQAVGRQAGVRVGHGDEAGPRVAGVAQQRFALGASTGLPSRRLQHGEGRA